MVCDIEEVVDDLSGGELDDADQKIEEIKDEKDNEDEEIEEIKGEMDDNNEDAEDDDDMLLNSSNLQVELNQDLLLEDTETSNVFQDNVATTIDETNNEGTVQFNQAFAFLE